MLPIGNVVSYREDDAEACELDVLGVPEPLPGTARWTLGLFNVAGPDDYLLHVAVADTDHLRAFVLDQLGNRKEIAHLQTALVYEHRIKSVVLPMSADGE